MARAPFMAHIGQHKVTAIEVDNMPFAPYASEQDKLERFVNAFGTQSFRDQADRDYIAARLTCRHELFPQFLWSSHQAIEKYLKAILLYNRIKANKVGLDLAQALSLTQSLSFEIRLSKRSRKFIDYLAEIGEFRYIDVPFHVYGNILIDLDLAVWEIRRYCQVLDVAGKQLPFEELKLLDAAWSDLASSEENPPYKFRLHGGLLESIVSDRKHPSRAALLWHNPCFGVRRRATVKAKNHSNAENSLLYLYPEMLDELLKYVFIPKKLVAGYRRHLSEIKAGAKARP
ncbi:HEPN domain-containing protein [Gilvimarinus agarilyticus]|uniref:HEPN domain-containing protein n=1 Tax=Gilvimarinus agarilyticus TaxID=679259 RepID=UPI00069687D3|nr:HEPN domain-containing protein [Gilvimarinus agarilyticus]